MSFGKKPKSYVRLTLGSKKETGGPGSGWFEDRGREMSGKCNTRGVTGETRSV